MKERITYFGDERDLCFNCERPPEVCDNRYATCTFKENQQITGNYNERNAAINHSCGFKEVPLWDKKDGIAAFAKQVAGYTEPFLERENKLVRS